MAVHHQRGPRVPQGNDGLAENYAQAQARLTQLEDVIKAEMQRRTELHEGAASNQNDPERVSVVGASEPELGSAERDAAVTGALKGIFEFGEQQETQPKPANDQPEWVSFEDGLRMNVDDETVAILERIDPTDGWEDGGWRSHIVSTDLPLHGLHLADFDSLEQGKEALEKWLDYARDGEAYQPEQPERPEPVQEANRLGQPFAEREGRSFQPSGRQPGRYDALRTEVTAEAIARDEWNAVALDLPADADPRLLFLVANTARGVHFSLSDRAGEVLSLDGLDAATRQQAEMWSGLADKAAARHKEAEARIRGLSAETTMSKEAIDYDPWAAVYQPIPSDADAELLQRAHSTAMGCANAVAGEPGPSRNAFEQTILFGADQTRQQNFERAVRRIDELAGRLRAAQPDAELAETPPGLDELAAPLRAGSPAPEQASPETEFSLETIKHDPWSAVYLDIPQNADPTLLKEAHATVVRCCEAVSRPPHPFDIYAPDNGHAPERNFENAVRRLDELGSRLRVPHEPSEALTVETTQTPGAQEQEPVAEPERTSKAKLAEEILAQQDGMHSHYDIGPWQGGFAVFRIYEIEDEVSEPSLPTGQQVLGRAETLDQLHDTIIDGSALTAYPSWVTDEQMNEAQNSQSLTLDDIAERVQRILDDPTREADELDPAVLQALQERRSADIEAVQAAITATKDELLQPSAGDEDQQDRSTAADPAAEPIEEAASTREQSDANQVQYSRWSDRPISSAGHEITGHSHGGGRGQGQSR